MNNNCQNKTIYSDNNILLKIDFSKKRNIRYSVFLILNNCIVVIFDSVDFVLCKQNVQTVMIDSSLDNIQNDLKKFATKSFIALSYITVQSKQKLKNTQKYNLRKTSKKGESLLPQTVKIEFSFMLRFVLHTQKI